MSWESPQQYFRGLDLTKLEIDQAYLNVTAEDKVYLYKLSENCNLCPYSLVGEVDTSLVTVVNTHHANHFLIRPTGDEQYIRTDSENLNGICELTAKLGEFGVYDLRVNSDCHLETALEPVKENIALLVCFAALVLIGLVMLALKYLPWKPIHKFETWMGWRHSVEEKQAKKRLRSLDTFRGISIALMIFVNDGGGGYWFMEHATWDGLLVADLVFPWFVWIMGVCIPMAIRSHLRKKTAYSTVLWQVAVRSVKLFLLGFILNTLGGWLQLSRLRVPGVLQRFGISYFVVTMVAFTFAKNRPEDRPINHFTDILDNWPQWLVMSGILLIHQLVIWLVTIPGCPQGYRGPGGLHDWSPERNYSHCIGGVTGYIDKEFFTVQHIYGNPTAKGVYSATEFDPEGIWGSLTTIFQVWLGYQAGYILQVYKGDKARLARWLIWSVATGIIGCILCKGSQFDGWVPINKNLWSISFVMVTTCFAYILLALLYFVIDVKGYWKGQPWFYAGMNSILLYCGHSVGYQLFPFHFQAGSMRTHSARLPESLWGVACWLIIAFVLYKKKVFVTV